MKRKVDASVIFISSCQNNQWALEIAGEENSLFTSKLLQVWNSGRFTGDYEKFYDDIFKKMPREQKPNYSLLGAHNYQFQKERPFTI